MGYFASLYRQVTVEVRTAIHNAEFDDGARMDRFDTILGNRYFAASRQTGRQSQRPRAAGDAAHRGL